MEIRILMRDHKVGMGRLAMALGMRPGELARELREELSEARRAEIIAKIEEIGEKR